MNIWTDVLQPLYQMFSDTSDILLNTLFNPVDLTFLQNWGVTGVNIPESMPLISVVFIVLIPIVIIISIVRLLLAR